MSLRLGKFELHEVRDGTFALDGGAMFGVVPKPLWEKKHPADARNRIELALRCLLIVDGPRRVLVDTGIGTRWSEKLRDIYRIDHSRFDLDRELARAGCSRADITDVVLTHLHFDHAGGVTHLEGARPALSFPRATSGSGSSAPSRSGATERSPICRRLPSGSPPCWRCVESPLRAGSPRARSGPR